VLLRLRFLLDSVVAAPFTRGFRGRSIRFCVTIVVFFTILSITGCSSGNSSSAMWGDYISRLQRVLDTTIEVPAVSPATYPNQRQLRQDTQALRINLLDFLSLLDCELNRVIATRNSSLGKVMPASQRWLYEVDLINALQQCIESLSNEDDSAGVVADLQSILSAKQAELGIVVWNATFAGPEFQQFMSARQGTLDSDFLFAYYGNLSTALVQLARWINEPMEPGGSAEYERINQELLTYPLYGRLMLSIREATLNLEAVSTTLRRNMQQRSLCISNKPTPKANILRNILVNIYTARVQPYIAELSKAHGEWYPLLSAMANELPAEPLKSYLAHHISQQDNSTYQRFKQASVQHAKAWTELLQQCGLRPGRS